MFQGGVESTQDDAIDLLFGAKTPGADDLLGGKKKGDEGAVDDDTPQDPDLETGQDDPQPQPKAKKKVVNPMDPDGIHERVSKKSTDEVTDDLFGADEDPDAGADPKQKQQIKPKTTPKKSVAADLEVDYEALFKKMVDDGVVGDVELPDGRTWDADTFKEALSLNVKTQYDDLLDKKGPYGKAIIEYEDNGGNPGDLLGLFREQRTVQEFDVTTPDGQQEFLASFYEAQGYTEKSIERTLKSLVDQGGDVLKEEAEEKKALWDAQYTEEIENTQKQQALQARQMEEAARNFNKNISDSLTKDAELTPKERKELGSYILSYSKKFNGQDVSQFYLDMLDIQKDPQAYVELAKAVKGLKTGEYKKKIADKVKKEVSANTFLRIKNGAALSNRDGGNPDLNDGGEESSFVTLLSKRK